MKGARKLRMALLGIVLAACGDGGAGPENVVYEVRVVGSETVFDDRTIVVVYTLVVEDDSGPVEGAFLRFSSNLGTISDQSERSGAAGAASVTWDLTADDGERLRSATLSACADDSDPPACELEVIGTLQVELPPTGN